MFLKIYFLLIILISSNIISLPILIFSTQDTASLGHFRSQECLAGLHGHIFQTLGRKGREDGLGALLGFSNLRLLDLLLLFLRDGLQLVLVGRGLFILRNEATPVGALHVVAFGEFTTNEKLLQPIHWMNVLHAAFDDLSNFFAALVGAHNSDRFTLHKNVTFCENFQRLQRLALRSD